MNSSSTAIIPNASIPPAEIIAELKSQHYAELRRLSDLAFVFLNAADGDQIAAERLLDDSLTLLMEGGVLQLWRYRIVLDMVREGL